MNTGWTRAIFAMLIILSVSFATSDVSGDGGNLFANETAVKMCQEQNVQAVYKCIGNVVRVVSSAPGEGSTFYRPDGGVVHCPVVPAPELGAECLHMLMPNFCPEESECGATAQQIFPGLDESPEHTGDEDYYIVEGEGVSNQTEEPEEITPEPPSNPDTAAPNLHEMNQDEIPANNMPSSVDFPMSYLLAVVLFLGLVSVGLLFMMFKKSIEE